MHAARTYPSRPCSARFSMNSGRDMHPSCTRLELGTVRRTPPPLSVDLMVPFSLLDSCVCDAYVHGRACLFSMPCHATCIWSSSMASTGAKGPSRSRRTRKGTGTYTERRRGGEEDDIEQLAWPIRMCGSSELAELKLSCER
jgi:hypothetical protein